MDFAETAEQAMLREAVGRIAAKYGHDYFSAKVKSGGHSEELWRDVGAAGFLGVSIPERYGGGGMGITELAIVAEEIAAPEKQFLLFFDGVRVPAERLLGTEGEGLRQVFHGLNPERIIGAAGANGIGRYALARAAAYAGQRQVWGVPIGSHQGVAHPLASAKIEVELARLATQKAAWAHDLGRAEAGEIANMAKYAAAEAALHALDAAIQAHGGNGFTTEYGLADLWSMTRVLRTAPVSREMILNYVAEHSLGLPRSY